MKRQFDCVVCGSCTVDIVVRPFPLDKPIGTSRLLPADKIEATTGGLVSNSGIAMSRLGMRVTAFSYVGDDQWSHIVRDRFKTNGVSTDYLLTHAEMPTSTTIVLVDEEGERSFSHAQGAPKRMDRKMFFDHLDVFAASEMMLIGYYSLMPNLESDLPEILAAIRELGCKTALDAAGTGGTIEPLDQILPHLDVYVPSFVEARAQTGETDPRRIIERFRRYAPSTLLGVKLGDQGALLSPASGEFVPIPAVAPPGPLIDTTGAGDSFYAGLLAGLGRGMDTASAGALAAAAGACCVTELGASDGTRGFAETARLAGLAPIIDP